MVIDGAWGNGKTEFCQKFVNLISSSHPEFRCLYLDTYKFDHSDDPLLMLITGISSLLENGPKKESLLKKSIPIAKVLSKVAGQAAVGWLLKNNADSISEEFSKAISEGNDELLNLGIKRIFKNFEAIEENLKIFKDALKEVAEEKPLIILLDELDRCRPSFALSLLEKIKHVFDIQGIKFLFTANLTQLEAVVKKQYGYEINSERYLTKFFNFIVKLPDEFSKDQFTFKNNSFTLFKDLIRKNENLRGFFAKNEDSYDVAEYFISKDRLPLRDIEKLCRNLNALNALGGECEINKNKHWFYGTGFFLGVYLYTFYPEIASKLLLKTITEQELASFFGKKADVLKTKSIIDSVDIFYVVFLHDSVAAGNVTLTDDEKLHWDEFLKQNLGHTLLYTTDDKRSVLTKSIRALQLL